ncbi:MAG: hypothetical protein PHH13_05800 [Candidatus Peribacteraceae bacterium]|nr:hypothetical protein [Candidatus Peribacteraceae bacterium]
MGSLYIGGIELLEPDPKLHALQRKLRGQHLAEMGVSGSSTNPQENNALLQVLFGRLNSTFSDYISCISSRGLSDFFLYQYEQMTKVYAKHKTGQLSPSDDALFQRIAPSRMIALRFIVERIVLLGETDDDSIPHEIKNFAAHRIFTCAEELVDLYISSDQTHLAFPEHTRVTVDLKTPPFLFLRLDALDPDFGQRVRDSQINNKEKLRMKELLGGLELVGDSDARRRHLDSTLQSIVGTDLDNIFHVLWEFCMPFPLPLPEGQKYPIPFCVEEQLLQDIAKKHRISREIVSKIVDAFLLTREKMETEKHEVYISKNKYRSFSRPLLRLPHTKGWHITWSPEMAKESLDHFHNMLPFGQAPVEWMPALEAPLSRLNNELSARFEDRYSELMGERNFVGARFKRRIGKDTARIRIPDDIGEIDHLAYSAKFDLLVVTECKFVRWGSNPKDYYNDRWDFVKKKGSYVQQVTRKVEWVQKEFFAVFAAMKSVLPIPADAALPSRVAHCIVTYYPSPVSLFVHSCPCLSFARFFDALDAADDWPFETGVKQYSPAKAQSHAVAEI